MIKDMYNIKQIKPSCNSCVTFPNMELNFGVDAYISQRIIATGVRRVNKSVDSPIDPR